MEDDRRVAAQNGADDFLSKPLREDELLEKIRNLLHISYSYEDTGRNQGQTGAGAAVVTLSSENLRQLPLELVEQLRGATLSGNKRLLDKLILEVRERGDAQSADGLDQLAGKYEYDALAALLEKACRP